jgi:hypothetical protein
MKKYVVIPDFQNHRGGVALCHGSSLIKPPNPNFIHIRSLSSMPVFFTSNKYLAYNALVFADGALTLSF